MKKNEEFGGFHQLYIMIRNQFEEVHKLVSPRMKK
jgi:hypothetical protein